MKAATRKAKAPPEAYPWPLILRVRPALDVTEEQFLALCQLNDALWIERTAEGDWSIMPPVGGTSGRGEASIIARLWVWAERDGTGTVFSPSTGFRLPNGAVRAPDASWLPNSRLEQLSAQEWERFLPLCPDFVLELRSPSDRLEALQAKMAEYIANGARLGWLLDPEARQVYVYRPDAPVQRLDNPQTLAGDPVLPGFALDLREIW
ncbi:MAG TPA: Uma2 family endonuclease [Chloroflexota bacterium]|nr:Uma2 family endonuclease [Chloroflexota bacterium]